MAERSTAAGATWVSDFFRDADKLDLPLLMSWFGDSIELRIANMPAVVGRAEVEKTFREFWSNLSGMSHSCEELMLNGDNAAQMAVVTYTRKDGKKVSMPVASYIRKQPDGKFDRLWIYIDINPLFAGN